VLHQVGSGVLGPVFRTHDPEDDRLVAVKAFTLDLTPEQADALAAELARLNSLDLASRHVAAAVDAGVEESVPFLAQFYVAGESLDAAIRQYGPAPAPDAARLIAHVAEALDAGARVGVFHGALHPRDVLVTPGETHLTGLGVASALEAIGARAPVRRPYAAPERESGGPWGAAADVFALGAIAHEVLTGRRALPGTEEPLPGLGDLKVANVAALRDTLESALDPDPERRPATAVEFATSLVAALGLGPETPADGQGATPRSRRKRVKAAPKLPGIDEPLVMPEVMSEVVSEPVPEPTPDANPDAGLVVDPAVAPEIFEDTAPAGTADPVELAAADLDEALAADEARDTGQAPPDLDLSSIDIDRPESERESPEPDLGLDDLSLSLAPVELDSPRADRPADLEALEQDLERFELPDAERVPASPAADADHEGLAELADDRSVDDLRDPGMLVSEPPVPRALDPGSAYRPATPTRRFEAYGEPQPAGRTWMAPAGIGVAIGLVIGVAAGYWLWSGAAGSGTTAVPSGVTASLPPAPTAQPAAAQPAPVRPEPPAPVTPAATTQQPAQPVPQPPPQTAAPAPVPAAPSPSVAPPAAAAPAEPRVGRIRVRSTPSRADVFLDGVREGVTPRDLGSLAFGRYTVRLTRPGYQPVERTVTLNAESAESRLSVTLQRVARPPAAAAPRAPAAAAPAPAPPAPVVTVASIDVETRPPGARVILDGRPAGTAPIQLVDIAPGPHTVRLDLDGYRPWTTTVTVKPGERTRVTASLERQSPR
jgi:serine/threonine-protein kinase